VDVSKQMTLDLNIKVGVDVRILSRPITGIGRYTLEMCILLNKMPSISLYLYSPAPILQQYLPYLNQSVMRVNNLKSGLMRQLWGESVLPFWARQDEINVFWGPAHRLPFLLPDSIPGVVTIHDLVWKFAPETMRPLSRLIDRKQMPFAISKAKHIVTDSYATERAVLEEFKVNHSSVTAISLGRSQLPAGSGAEGLLALGIEGPYFLFVGTLEPRKNLISLLLAYAKLAGAHKEKAILVIAGGEGWGDVNLKENIISMGLENQVKLTGYIDEQTLATLYSNALFLAMPSLYEGFGLPIVEAMSFGTPVLSSNNSSMPEVVGKGGMLIDARSIDSISSGLQKMITDDEFRGSLAANAKESASRFDWNQSVRQLVTVFKKVTSEHYKI
jgi:glycosyltransferase involved in cell wall biosynthesis